MTVLPAWVHWLQALSVPAIALAGVIIAASNYFLAVKKRGDDLFDRRYDFFDRARRLFLENTQIERTTGKTQWRDALAEESRFLFDDDIADHIRRWQVPLDEQWIGDDHFSASFVQPFSSYLRFRR